MTQKFGVADVTIPKIKSCPIIHISINSKLHTFWSNINCILSLEDYVTFNKHILINRSIHKIRKTQHQYPYLVIKGRNF